MSKNSTSLVKELNTELNAMGKSDMYRNVGNDVEQENGKCPKGWTDKQARSPEEEVGLIYPGSRRAS